MKKAFFIISLLLLNSLVFAQKNPYSANILAQGKLMTNSFVNKNYDSLIAFMYPKMVESLGGKGVLLEAIKSIFEQNPSLEVVDAAIHDPGELITEANQYQCIVSQTIVLKAKGGKLKSKSYLLALSDDNGKNWFFIDTAPGIDKLKEKLSTISDKLVIPAPEKPTFIPD